MSAFGDPYGVNAYWLEKLESLGGNHRNIPFIAKTIDLLKFRVKISMPGDDCSGIMKCFIYCVLYPKGHKIVSEDLVNQWEAEGLLKQMSYGMEEEVGKCYLKEMLLSGGVFQDVVFAYGDSLNDRDAVVYSCVMCPDAYDAARHISQDMIAIYDGDGDECELTYLTRYVAVHEPGVDVEKFINKLTSSIIHPTTFMHFGTSGRTTRLLECILSTSSPNLRVLSIQGVVLKNEFKYLVGNLLDRRLRYLSITAEFELGQLKDLHTLALNQNGVELEHKSTSLSTTWSSKHDKSPMFQFQPFLYKFKSVRQLYVTSQNTEVLELGMMRNLRILHISDCKYLEKLYGEVPSNNPLRVLRIVNCPQLLYLHIYAQNVKEIVIRNCPRLDLTQRRYEYAFYALEYLEIRGMNELTELPNLLGTANNLRYFIIADCQELGSLTTSKHNFTCLRDLRIERCPGLQSLPQIMRNLPNLKSLHINECPALTDCYKTKTDGPEWDFISHIPNLTFDGQRITTIQQESGSQVDSNALPIYSSFEEGNTKGLTRQDVLNEAKRTCCLLPTEFEFERLKVVQLWMGRGLIDNKSLQYLNKLVHMEDLGTRLFEILRQDNFFKSSTIDIFTGEQLYVVNLTTVEQFLNEVDNDEGEYVKSVDEKETDEALLKSWHLTLNSKFIDHSTFETLKRFRELRTLLFICPDGSSLTKLPSDLFSALRKLQSLDLSGSQISELPGSIGYNTELYFLDLSFTLIEELPESLGRLTKLQTLRLRGCKHLSSLPNCTRSLINLRHLDFDVVGQLSSMPPGLGALTQLHTLPGFIVGKQKGCSLREIVQLDNLTGRFCLSGLENNVVDIRKVLLRKRRLTQLELRWNHYSSNSTGYEVDLSNVTDISNLQPPGNLQELQIVCFPGSEFPSWIKDTSFPWLVRIRLLKCEKVASLNVNLGYIRWLKYLEINQMKAATTIDLGFPDDVGSTAFAGLKELKIDGMLELTTWKGAVKVQDFPVLSNLTLRSCPKLEELPFRYPLRSLEHLEISNCAMLKSLPTGISLGSRSTLRINECPLLEQTCSKEGDDWCKIEQAESIWINFKNILSTDEKTSDSDSDYESNLTNDGDFEEEQQNGAALVN